MVTSIAIVCLDWTAVGGAEQYAITLRNALRKIGIKSDIFAYDSCVRSFSLGEADYKIPLHSDKIKEYDAIFYNSTGCYDETVICESNNYWATVDYISSFNKESHCMLHGPRQVTYNDIDAFMKHAKATKLWFTREAALYEFLKTSSVSMNVDYLSIPVDVMLSAFEDKERRFIMTSRALSMKNQHKIISAFSKTDLILDVYGFKSTSDKYYIQCAQIASNNQNITLHTITPNKEIKEQLQTAMFHINVADHSDKVDDFMLETTTAEAVLSGCMPIVNKQSSRLLDENSCFIIDEDASNLAEVFIDIIKTSDEELKTKILNSLRIIENHYDDILIAKKLVSSFKTVYGYTRGLQCVLDTRLSRRKMYGDGFTTAKARFFVAMIEEKTARLGYMFENGDNEYEKLEDTLVDLANYSIMFLENIKNGNYKNR